MTTHTGVHATGPTPAMSRGAANIPKTEGAGSQGKAQGRDIDVGSTDI